MRINQQAFANHSKNIHLLTFISIVIINTLILCLAIYLKRGGIPTRIAMFYDTPTTILAALSLIIYFSKIKLKSRLINWLASSCFAVYLLHTHYALIGEYANIVRLLFYSHNGIVALLYIGIFIILVFTLSIIIDQPRKWLWNIIWKQFEKRTRIIKSDKL